MANDEDMRRLMEQLFPTLYYRFASTSIDIVKPAPFVPSDSITKDFFENMKMVLFKKRLMILKRWEKYFGISCLKALSSHAMYLRYVMFACEIEIGFSDDIFDMILNVCALVLTFITETLDNTDVNFCDLSVDIFMAFYEKNLEEPFNWHGGFKQFAVCLRENYLQGGKCFNYDFEIPVTYRVSFQKNANNVMEKVFEKSHPKPDYINHYDVMSNLDCHVLATEVLFVTKTKLPPLPSPGELMLRIRANRQRAMDSKLRTAGTDSKYKTKWTNSKREEVFLTANITLPPVPNVTGGDSNHDATTTLESLKREDSATVNILKHKSPITERNLKPYARDFKRKEAASDPKREVVSSDSKSKVKASDPKAVAKASDPRAAAKVSEPKAVAKAFNPKAVAKVSDPNCEVKAIDPKAVAKVSDPKAVAKASDPKAVAKAIDPKAVAKAIEPKAVAKTIEPKAVAKAIEPKAVAKTIEPKAVAKAIEPKAVAKASDAQAVAKTSNPKVTMNTIDSNSQACDLVKQKANIAWCENIIKQVIKCNNSDRSYPNETRNRILKEADETLEHLKSIIKSLIKVLDEYYEE